MITFKTFINELYEIGVYDKQIKTYIVGSRDKMYLINTKLNCEILGDVFSKLYEELDIISKMNNSDKKTNAVLDNYCDQDKDYYMTKKLKIVYFKVPDVIHGYIEDEIFYMDRTSYASDPLSSLLIKKIVKQLNIKTVKVVDGDEIFDYDIKEIKGEIPDIAYHGTSLNYLKKILKIGLRPDISPSNYDMVQHENLLFFTTSLLNAIEYAVVTMRKNESTPVIIKFKIPDKDLIIADFDIERFSGIDKHYKHINKVAQTSDYDIYKNYRGNIDPDKLAKELGVYGYKGVINPTMFQSVFFYNKKEPVGRFRLKDFTEIEYQPDLKNYLEKEKK